MQHLNSHFQFWSSQPPSIQSDSQDLGIGNPVPPPILNEHLACYLTDWGMRYLYEDCIHVLQSNMTQGNEELVKEWLRIVTIVTAMGYLNSGFSVSEIGQARKFRLGL